MNVPFFDIKNQYSSINGEIGEALKGVFESCSFVGGKYVEKFEQEFASYLGAKNAIGCGNGTDALTLALRACGVHPGDEVITTAFSFFATAEAIASIGAIPVFVDVRLSDYTIAPDKIESAITEKTKAIIPVQIFGSCCDMDKIMAIARKHGLKVIEDDAQAVGSSYKNRKAGSLADIGCFSFYPTKNLGGCGDGGMVTTNDDELAIIVKAMREHGAGEYGSTAVKAMGGICAEDVTGETATELYNPLKYCNYLIGYNSRLDGIQACVLSIKLKLLDQYNERRTKIAERYRELLTSKVVLPEYSPDVTPCWHQFGIRTDSKYKLCEYLREHGVGSGTFYPVPLHKQKAFNLTNCKNPGASLPNAERICAETVCLPIYPELTDGEVNHVIQTVNSFFEVAE